MRMSSILLASIPALASIATVAQAQINSSPPPLMGQPSFQLYSVPGVVSIGGLGTFFACTNVTSADIRVGVEIFGPAGGAAFDDASATSLDISPSGTLIFGTGGAAGLSIDSNLGSGGLSKGSARILATTKSGIICSAFIADRGNAPPTSMVQLTIVTKTKQKGD